MNSPYRKLPTYGDSFAGFTILRTPLPNREDRVFPRHPGGTLIDWTAHEFHLAQDDRRRLFALGRHGGGAFAVEMQGPAGWALDALQAMDERALYAILYSIAEGAEHAHTEARDAEAQRWRRAHVEKRIKSTRRKGRVYVEIKPVYRFEAEGQPVQGEFTDILAGEQAARAAFPHARTVSAHVVR